jgi:hypothetical protein
MSARLLTRFMHPADGADGKEEEEDDGGWPSAACPPPPPPNGLGLFGFLGRLYFIVWSCFHLNFFSSLFFSLLLGVNGMGTVAAGRR